MRVSLVESPMLLPPFPLLDLENFAGAYRGVQAAPVGSVRTDMRPSHGFWKPIPPHRSFLPFRWSECVPWCHVLLSGGSDPGGALGQCPDCHLLELLALVPVPVLGSARHTLLEGGFCRSFVVGEGIRGL